MLTSATRGETLTPNPNECNSTLTSGTNNIYPYPYIDINDRGHRLRITHTRRRLFGTDIAQPSLTPESFSLGGSIVFANEEKYLVS